MFMPCLAVERWLRRATALYLAAPVAIFLCGWFRAPLAVALTALLVWGVWRTGWKTHRGPDDGGVFRVPAWALALGGALPALALVMMSGAGGWGAGDSDWYKHDTLLLDLVSRAWPVTYGTSRGPVLLVYYVAFYLPAALLGKWTGSYTVASQALAATMLLGIWLSLAWLALLGRRGGGLRTGGWWVACGLFFGFSGMDVLGQTAVNVSLGHRWSEGGWNDIEWWAQAFQYPSNAAALFWAPQHAVAAWLPTALVLAGSLEAGPERSGRPVDAWPLCLALFWSPFAALGMAPLLVGSAWHGFTAGGKRTLAALLGPSNLAALAVALSAVVYYAARSGDCAVPAVADVAAGRSPTPLLDGHPGRWWAVYGAFVTLEFALLAAVVAATFAGDRDETAATERRLLAAAALSLVLLPCLHYGYANDLVMRGALPSLWTLQVLVLRRWQAVGTEKRRSRWRVAAGATILALGLCNAGLEYRRHVQRMWQAGSWRDGARDELRAGRDHAPPPVASLFELQRTLYARPGFDFARQYLGDPRSFYGRWLAPPASSPPQSVAE